jgi:hypothetical protein
MEASGVVKKMASSFNIFSHITIFGITTILVVDGNHFNRTIIPELVNSKLNGLKTLTHNLHRILR